MKRFPEQEVLKNRAEAGSLDMELSKQLGAKIAAYHYDLPGIDTLDGAGRVREIVQELNAAFSDTRFELSTSNVARFNSKASKCLKAQTTHLNKRAGLGLIRRCHGDLHLRNIVMIEGEPIPFDALEFDERLATTDVLYDLAFLIMDLLHLGLQNQANVVLNRYVHSSWEFVEAHGFQVLPLFLALRAAIRSMVSSQASLRDGTKAESLRAESELYLVEAASYLDPVAPVLVAVGGFSGTGKSTLAAELAPKLGQFPGAVLLRSDLERKNCSVLRNTIVCPRMPTIRWPISTSTIAFSTRRVSHFNRGTP